APFSNHGSYVEIVAPGQSIYSTTPVSYLFHGQYFNGVPSGYAYFSGTSMATPHVAAAAARVWAPSGQFKALTAAAIKDRLILNGDPVWVAENPNMLNPEDG